MTQSELAAAVFAANDVALQWYAVTHGTAVPGTAGSVVVTTPATGGFSASFGPGTLVLAGVALLALVLIFKK